MQDEDAVLDPQEDASVSPEDRFANDKSVDTSPIDPVEVESETEEAEDDLENEADSSTAEVEDLEEKADSQDDDADYSANVKARIDKLTGRLRTSERVSDTKDMRIAELELQLSAQPQVQEPLKTLADFDYNDAEYESYKVERSDRMAESAAEKAVQRLMQESSTAEVADKFADREKVFAETVKDYESVVRNPTLRISPAMAAVMKGNENGPEIAYYLGSNPDIAKQLSSLSPEDAGFELGLIHIKLSAEKAKVAKKSVTKAPPPVPKIKAGDPGRVKKITDPDLSDSEFRKMRRKQIANR